MQVRSISDCGMVVDRASRRRQSRAKADGRRPSGRDRELEQNSANSALDKSAAKNMIPIFPDRIAEQARQPS